MVRAAGVLLLTALRMAHASKTCVASVWAGSVLAVAGAACAGIWAAAGWAARSASQKSGFRRACSLSIGVVSWA